MNLARRGFLFGAAAVAAPTIIGIDKVMKFFVPPTPDLVRFRVAAGARWFVEHPGDEMNHITGIPDPLVLDADRFRAMIEPGLREHFNNVYKEQAAVYGQDRSDRWASRRLGEAARAAARRVLSAADRDHGRLIGPEFARDPDGVSPQEQRRLGALSKPRPGSG